MFEKGEKRMLQTALHFSHTLLQEILQPGDHVDRCNDGQWPRYCFSSRTHRKNWSCL